MTLDKIAQRTLNGNCSGIPLTVGWEWWLRPGEVAVFYDGGRLKKCEFLLEVRLVAAAAAKSLQLCLTLCNPIDGSPPGSAVPGILQERTLEWVVISFSNAWKWKAKVQSLSRVRLLATP